MEVKVDCDDKVQVPIVVDDECTVQDVLEILCRVRDVAGVEPKGLLAALPSPSNAKPSAGASLPTAADHLQYLPPRVKMLPLVASNGSVRVLGFAAKQHSAQLRHLSEQLLAISQQIGEATSKPLVAKEPASLPKPAEPAQADEKIEFHDAFSGLSDIQQTVAKFRVSLASKLDALLSLSSISSDMKAKLLSARDAFQRGDISHCEKLMADAAPTASGGAVPSFSAFAGIAPSVPPEPTAGKKRMLTLPVSNQSSSASQAANKKVKSNSIGEASAASSTTTPTAAAVTTTTTSTSSSNSSNSKTASTAAVAKATTISASSAAAEASLRATGASDSKNTKHPAVKEVASAEATATTATATAAAAAAAAAAAPPASLPTKITPSTFVPPPPQPSAAVESSDDSSESSDTSSSDSDSDSGSGSSESDSSDSDEDSEEEKEEEEEVQVQQSKALPVSHHHASSAAPSAVSVHKTTPEDAPQATAMEVSTEPTASTTSVDMAATASSSSSSSSEEEDSDTDSSTASDSDSDDSSEEDSSDSDGDDKGKHQVFTQLSSPPATPAAITPASQTLSTAGKPTAALKGLLQGVAPIKAPSHFLPEPYRVPMTAAKQPLPSSGSGSDNDSDSDSNSEIDSEGSDEDEDRPLHSFAAAASPVVHASNGSQAVGSVSASGKLPSDVVITQAPVTFTAQVTGQRSLMSGNVKNVTKRSVHTRASKFESSPVSKQSLAEVIKASAKAGGEGVALEVVTEEAKGKAKGGRGAGRGAGGRGRGRGKGASAGRGSQS